MSKDELLRIVGPHYEYDNYVMEGKTNIKTMEPRFMYNIDFKTFFSVDTGRLCLKESLNQRRKEE